MAPTVRTAIAKASAKTIWETCFVPMKWERWDPDVEVLEDVSGPPTEGSTCTFVMKDGGTRIPTTLSGVEYARSLTFSGSAVGGLMKFSGTVNLVPLTKDDVSQPETTEITYSFELFGIIGFFFTTFKKTLVVGGTEKGLANMVTLSEEAQAKGAQE